jgi:hypothetical protein
MRLGARESGSGIIAADRRDVPVPADRGKRSADGLYEEVLVF